MLSAVIFGVLAAFLGAIPYLGIKDNHSDSSSWVLFMAFIVNGLIGFGVGYASCLGFYGPLGLSGDAAIGLLLLMGINTVLACLFSDSVTGGSLLALCLVMVLGFIGLSGAGCFRANDYQRMIGTIDDRRWQEDFSPVDVTHIRVVSEEQARWLGDKVIGEAPGSLGSRYRVGKFSIQRVRGELHWVAPLEFNSFSKWMSYGTTPGFVMVNAENRNIQARLVTKVGDKELRLRYLDSAFWGDNLARFVRGRYISTGLADYTFELDDHLKPYWTITVFEPSIGFWGPKVKGVLTVDPENGVVEFYDEKQGIPDWIDRVYPEEFVGDYLSWHGKYVQGWINSWWSEENVEVPTPFEGDPNALWMVWGSDGEPYWFTGLTSSSDSDQSLTGFMLVNTRTGAARRYRVTGPNETAVLQATDSAVSNFRGYHGTQPILYNIFGELTWVVPVVSDAHILQKVACVRASNAMVDLGDDVESALRAYRSRIAREGFTTAPTSHSAIIKKDGLTVARIGEEGGVRYLLFEELPDRIFSVGNGISPELAVTRIGDKVAIEYLETDDSIVPVLKFDNQALNIRKSKEQEELDRRNEITPEKK